MKPTIKLISLNIELARHKDRVVEFLREEKPDIVCLQELFEDDLFEFAELLGMRPAFAQMSNIGREEETEQPFFPYGVGMLSVVSFERIGRVYYRGSEEEAKAREFQGNSRDDPHPLLYVTVKKDDVSFRIGTTHFTWSAKGRTDVLQKSDLESLLDILAGIPEIVLCGDFNAPRGRKIFDTLASHYEDNIPQKYTTSIDVNLHRDGEKLRGESLMVDGLFTSPEYESSNVRLQDGVSDHMAIIAEVTQAT
jgi:endonuclease/exonuclease/phosphatase family metal-dependent hydrolase